MCEYLTGEAVEHFVSDLMPPGRERFGECTAVGFPRDGKLEAGVVYHNWDPARRMIEMSAAATSRRWMTWPRARLIFGYPFEFCDLVYARTDSPVIHRTFRLLGGSVFETPVWTICTLTKEACDGWR